MGRRWTVGRVAGNRKKQEDVLLFGSDEGSGVLYNRVIVKRGTDNMLIVVVEAALFIHMLT